MYRGINNYSTEFHLCPEMNLNSEIGCLVFHRVIYNFHTQTTRILMEASMNFFFSPIHGFCRTFAFSFARIFSCPFPSVNVFFAPPPSPSPAPPQSPFNWSVPCMESRVSVQVRTRPGGHFVMSIIKRMTIHGRIFRIESFILALVSKLFQPGRGWSRRERFKLLFHS